MVENGIRDFSRAKQKAGDRLNIPDGPFWPSNSEIENAILQRRKLFTETENKTLLHEGLEIAVELMNQLREFTPKLAGALLTGYATARTPVEIYLRADHADEVLAVLTELDIPAEAFEKRLRIGKSLRFVPGFRFVTDILPVEIIVLPHGSRSQPPLSPVDGKPMRFLNLNDVEAMVKTL